MASTRRAFRTRYPSLAYAMLGVPIMCIGGALLWYGYAWASIVDPNLTGISYWKAVLTGMFPGLLLPLAIITAGLATSLTFTHDVTFGASRTGPSIKLGLWIWALLTGFLFALAWGFVQS